MPRLIGADIPNSPQSSIKPGQAVTGMPNNSQQYIQNSSNILQGALKNQSEDLQQQYESIKVTQKAVGEIIQSDAETAIQVAKLKQTQKSNPWAGIADALKEYLTYQERMKQDKAKRQQELAEQQAKEREAYAKTRSEKDYATAFMEIQDLKVAWSAKGLNEKGVTSYTAALRDALRKYPNLTYEQIQKLTDDGYGIAVQHAKDQAGKQQKYFDDLRAAQQDTTTASLMFKLSKPLADLKATPYGDSSAIMSQIDTTIAEFLDDPNVDPLTRTLALNVAMKETLSGMDDRNVAYSELNQRIQAVSAYGNYAMELTQKVENNEMSPQQMKLLLQQKRIELGVPTGSSRNSAMVVSIWLIMAELSP